VGALAMLPQFGTLALVGAAFYREPPLALLLQTAVFVVWNKVITVQYFNWYLALAPLVLPQSRLAAGVAAGDGAAIVTVACLGLAWLLAEVRRRRPGGGAAPPTAHPNPLAALHPRMFSPHLECLPSQLHWNLWALHLEIWGQSTFAAVWAAGLLFFVANVAVVVAVVRNHRFVPSFRAGAPVRLPAAWWPS
jgi:hypothetical protein